MESPFRRRRSRRLHRVAGLKMRGVDAAACATASSPRPSRTSTCTQSPRNTRAGHHAGAARSVALGRGRADASRFGAHADAADPVDRAQEARHEARARAQIDVLRRAHLLDAPCVHHRQLVRHGERLLLVVRDQQERDADAALQGLQLDAHLLAQFRIERRQRLVQQQHVGLQHQRAGQGHALPLAARKLRGTARLPCR